MTRSTVYGWIALTLLTVTVLPATAQEAQGDTDTFQFFLDVSGVYTDNRDSTELNTENNFDLYLSPRVSAVLHGEQSLLDFHYKPSFRFRSNAGDTRDDNELYHNLGIDYRHDFTEQTRLKLSEAFDYTDNPVIAEGGARIRDDRSYIMNHIRAALSHKFGPRTVGSASATHYLKRYDDDDIARESDEDSVGADLSLWRQVAPTVGVHVDGRYKAYNFDSDVGIRRDFDVLFLGVGLDKVFNPKLRGGVVAGWQNIDYDDPTLEEQNEPYVQFNIRGQTVPTVRLTGTATYGIRDSDVYPFSSQQYTDINGRVEWDTSAKFTLAAYGTYRLSTYDSSNTPNAPDTAFYKSSEGDETTIVAAAEVAYKVTERHTLKFIQRIEDIDSDVAESFTKNTSTLLGTLAF